MVIELVRVVNHFHSSLDKPIKLEISIKSSWRWSQLECKLESAKTEANVSLYTPLLPLNAFYWRQIFNMHVADVNFNYSMIAGSGLTNLR